MSYKILQAALSLLICSHVIPAVENPLFAATILVTTTDNLADGSLAAAILAAVDGDVIDCTPISGQTIFTSAVFPAIGHNFTSDTSSLTIQGAGVILDGGGDHGIFSLGYGSAIISNFIIQNGLSKGGDGGFGLTGGGGGTGGGGALYLHSGTSMTISTLSLNNNQAIGGNGGAGNLGGNLGGSGGVEADLAGGMGAVHLPQVSAQELPVVAVAIAEGQLVVDWQETQIPSQTLLERVVAGRFPE